MYPISSVSTDPKVPDLTLNVGFYFHLKKNHLKKVYKNDFNAIKRQENVYFCCIYEQFFSQALK